MKRLYIQSLKKSKLSQGDTLLPSKLVLGYMYDTKIENILFSNSRTVTEVLILSNLGTLSLNIHELANECKEWAFSNDYHLISSKRKNTKSWECWTVYDDDRDNLLGYFPSDSETNSIFMAVDEVANILSKKLVQ